MKNFLTLFLSLSLLVGYANAKERANKQANETKSIEELVKEIKANPSNRRIAINRLKIQLRNINADIRRKIMLDLQHSFTGHTYTTAHKNLPMANNVVKSKTASSGSISSPIKSMPSPISIIKMPINLNSINAIKNSVNSMQNPINSMPSPINIIKIPINIKMPTRSMPNPITASSNIIKSILPFNKP